MRTRGGSTHSGSTSHRGDWWLYMLTVRRAISDVDNALSGEPIRPRLVHSAKRYNGRSLAGRTDQMVRLIVIGACGRSK